MTRRSARLATVAVLGMMAVATGSMSGHAPGVAAQGPPPPSTTAAVKADNFSFAPATLTVPVGTTVTWTNRDDIPHTVVSTDRSFKSKVLDTDEKFSYTFAGPGSFSYSCSIHPKMTGKVVVR
jgi:plastocyanin